MNDLVLISIPLNELKELISETVTQAVKAVSLPQKKPFQDYPDLLTRKQTSNMLGVCLATLDSWTTQGRLKKYRNGSIVRYKKNEVLESFQNFRKHERI